MIGEKVAKVYILETGQLITDGEYALKSELGDIGGKDILPQFNQGDLLLGDQLFAHNAAGLPAVIPDGIVWNGRVHRRGSRLKGYAGGAHERVYVDASGLPSSLPPLTGHIIVLGYMDSTGSVLTFDPAYLYYRWSL